MIFKYLNINVVFAFGYELNVTLGSSDSSRDGLKTSSLTQGTNILDLTNEASESADSSLHLNCSRVDKEIQPITKCPITQEKISKTKSYMLLVFF